MSGLIGPNGQPVTQEKETIDVTVGGAVLNVFVHAKDLMPIQAVQGKENEIFAALLGRSNAYQMYINALVREVVELRERLEILEKPTPVLFGGPGKIGA